MLVSEGGYFSKTLFHGDGKVLNMFFNLVECFSCISMLGGSSKYRECESNHNFLC